jgi:hypothetical protein
MERESGVTLPAQNIAIENKAARGHDESRQQVGGNTVLEDVGGRFDVFDLSLEEVKRRPKRVASYVERQETQEVRQRGACQPCRRSKRKVCTESSAS